MFAEKDYAQLTPEELVSEEKKLKAQQITTAVFVGVVVGIVLWAATHKGGIILPAILLIFVSRIGYTASQNLKRVQAEISRRNTGE